MRFVLKACPFATILVACGGSSGTETSGGDGAPDVTSTSDAQAVAQGEDDSGMPGIQDSAPSPGDAAATDAGAPHQDAANAAVCTPGAVQCAPMGKVQTCGSNGQWGAIATCAHGTCLIINIGTATTVQWSDGCRTSCPSGTMLCQSASMMQKDYCISSSGLGVCY
jgi:hypothetical protein